MNPNALSMSASFVFSVSHGLGAIFPDFVWRVCWIFKTLVILYSHCPLLPPPPKKSKIFYCEKKTHKFVTFFQERLFKQEWRKCEMTEECEQLFGVERTRCVRICLAPLCHEDLYAHDEVWHYFKKKMFDWIIDQCKNGKNYGFNIKTVFLCKNGSIFWIAISHKVFAQILKL